MNKIRYVEYDASHKDTFVFDVPEGHDCWLLVITQTPAIFLVGDEYRTCQPNTAILYGPYQRIYYRACDKHYVNDWIRFESNESYVINTPLPTGIPFTIQDNTYCHKIVQLIVTENILNNSYKNDTIDYLIRILFNKLLESYDYKGLNILDKKLYQLKEEIYRYPEREWTLECMSEKLNISTGYLQAMYKKNFNSSCIEDVIHSRINKAKEYLEFSQYSVSYIMNLCGYNSLEHFYRQFKKVTGLAPNKYRRMRKMS